MPDLGPIIVETALTCTPDLVENVRPPQHMNPALSAPRTGPRNAFGLRREYYGPLPKHDADDLVDAEDVVTGYLRQHIKKNSFAPYPNKSSASVGTWYWDSEQKTMNDLYRLSDRVFAADDFNAKDVVGTPWKSIFAKMKNDSHDNIFDTNDGWKNIPVYVNVPRVRKPPVMYKGPSLRYKTLIGLMTMACQSPASRSFRWQPYAVFWKNPNDPSAPEVRVHHEMYNSPDLIAEYIKVQHLPRAPGDTHEHVIFPLIPYSDGTHLSAFGSASAWPGYMAFGLQSKYDRGEISKHALHHFAHFPKVSSMSSMMIATKPCAVGT
jgi:hypothetical protein